jgi:hypothetical protein
MEDDSELGKSRWGASAVVGMDSNHFVSGSASPVVVGNDHAFSFCLVSSIAIRLT